MMTYITMHNMIVEDEAEEDNDFNYDQMGERVTMSHNDAPELDVFIANYQKIKDKKTHPKLQEDFIEHLWQNYPNLYNNISSE
jgi:DNA-binding ferritin-like protein